MQELSDNLDLIVANPQYQTFLEHAMRVFIKILQVKVLVRFNLLFSLFSILSISLFQSLSIYLSLSQAHTHKPIIQLLILLLNSVIFFIEIRNLNFYFYISFVILSFAGGNRSLYRRAPHPASKEAGPGNDSTTARKRSSQTLRQEHTLTGIQAIK